MKNPLISSIVNIGLLSKRGTTMFSKQTAILWACVTLLEPNFNKVDVYEHVIYSWADRPAQECITCSNELVLAKQKGASEVRSVWYDDT